MRDSAIGTYGTIALILSIGLRVALFSALIANGTPLQSAAVLIAICALSRTFLLWPWVVLPASRPSSGTKAKKAAKDESGLSTRYGAPGWSALSAAIFCSLPAVAMMSAATDLPATLCAIFVSMALIAGTIQLARRNIGGHTGDVLGAAQQLSEIGLLLGLVVLM